MVDTINEPIAKALARCARGQKSNLLAHLEELEVNYPVDETSTSVHSYYIKIDGNGQLVTSDLACCVADQMIEYAIPNEKIIEAQKEKDTSGSSSLFRRLTKEAERLFVKTKNSGEAGELLLFIFAEMVFKFPQLMTKMSLKTSAGMHYNGADGVYAEGREDGGLNLYFGEAKLYKNSTKAIKDMFNSLTPFLIEERKDSSKRSREIVLLNSNLDLNDQKVTELLKKYFQKNTNESRLVQYCGIALVGYDSKIYADAVIKSQDIKNKANREFKKQILKIKKSLETNEITDFQIHVICLPFKSVKEFREAVASEMGI